MKRPDVRVGDFWTSGDDGALIFVSDAFTSDEASRFAFVCVWPKGHLSFHVRQSQPVFFHKFTLVSR